MSNKKVNIVDDCMGSGKTEGVFQLINSHPERLYLCIVPLRTEIKRYMEKINRKTYTPICFNKNRQKLDNLKELLEMGVSIVSTHALFLDIDEEVIELIKSRNYHLVIDEAISVLSIISTGAKHSELDETDLQEGIPSLTRDEIQWLFDNNMMIVDPNDSSKIIWTGKPSDYHDYLWVERLAKNNALVYINNTVMLWHFPHLVFTLFDSITILTYLFEKSLLCSYFKVYGIQYQLYSVKQTGIAENEDRLYEFTQYNPKKENRKILADLINVCEDESLNSIGNKWGRSFPLSASWYKANNKGDKKKLKQLQNNTTTFYRRRQDAPRDSVMWTTYKKFRNILCPKGYKTIDELQQEPSFVSCNAMATNDYKERYNLSFLCDLHINPNICRFFDLHGIEVDREGYALCMLLQWIFRSRVRDNEEINLYIPSERMRNIYYDWISA